MQKTNFKFEVLVHDDASTDGTADIIREYEEKFPDVIKPIYQKENQYSKGIRIFKEFQLHRAKGRYIAFCEGDDYWCDENKLQCQYDFLKSHPDCLMCTNQTEVFDDSTGNTVKFFPPLSMNITGGTIDCQQYLQYYGQFDYFLHTSSFFVEKKTFENLLYENPGFYSVCATVADDPLLLWFAFHAKIGYLPQIMSKYRVNHGTGWSYAINTSQKLSLKHLQTKLKMFQEFDSFSAFRFKDEIKKIIHRRSISGFRFCIFNHLKKDKIFFAKYISFIDKFLCYKDKLKWDVKKILKTLFRKR